MIYYVTHTLLAIAVTDTYHATDYKAVIWKISKNFILGDFLMFFRTFLACWIKI